MSSARTSVKETVRIARHAALVRDVALPRAAGRKDRLLRHCYSPLECSVAVETALSVECVSSITGRSLELQCRFLSGLCCWTTTGMEIVTFDVKRWIHTFEVFTLSLVGLKTLEFHISGFALAFLGKKPCKIHFTCTFRWQLIYRQLGKNVMHKMLVLSPYIMHEIMAG